MKARSSSIAHLHTPYPTLNSVIAITKIRWAPRLLPLSPELPLLLEQWTFPHSVFSGSQLRSYQLLTNPQSFSFSSFHVCPLSSLKQAGTLPAMPAGLARHPMREHSCHSALGNLLAFFSCACTNMAGCTGAKRKFRHLPVL